jgi:molecular chaperone GrpE
MPEHEAPPPGGEPEVMEPPGESTPPQDPIEALAHEAESPETSPEAFDPVEALRAERDEYLEHLRRVQADFENYRKRMLREQTSHVERATEGLIEQLLPVLDAFELALLNSGTDSERLQKGLELVYSELLGVLEKAGLERIEARGKPFDPAEHEAVMQVDRPEGEGGEPGVLDVVRTGYRLKGRVLRPAMVKVAT